MKIKALVLAICTLMAGVSFAQSNNLTATPSSASATSKTAALPNKSTSASSMTEAAGGGPDKVWINTKSNTYHCPGTKYYGKTKVGEYLTEVAAKAKGAHADHGKECGK